MPVPEFLKFHKDLADCLQRDEADTWNWFASDKLTSDAFAENRLTLLKNAVRLDPASHESLFVAANEVAAFLEIDAPVTLYQGAGSARNAMLVYAPDEICIVFEGETLDILSGPELRCLLGHEMAHYLHKSREQGKYFTMDRILEWMCGEHGAHQAHARSLWLSRLYQEVFADRVGHAVCGDRDAAISLLIKVTSGLKTFSVDSYLEQAAEALELSEKDGAQGASHPEIYIRAMALSDWAKDPDSANARLPDLVEGQVRLERLDMLGQRRLTDLTKAVFERFLAADWAGSEEVEAHARAFFPDFERPKSAPEGALDALDTASEDVKDYVATLLLDFAAVDPDLEDIPLLDAMAFAKQHGLSDVLEPRIIKDLGIAKKKLTALQDAAGRDVP